MKRHASDANSFEAAVRHYREGKRQEARRVCLALVERKPRDAQAQYLLGLLDLDAGHAEAARERFARAVALQPTSAPFHCNLGLAHAKLKALEPARESLTRALAIDSNLVEALLNLGLVQLDRGDLDDALKHLRRAAKQRPNSFAVLRALSRALLQKGDDEEAVACSKQILAIDPAHAASRRDLAISLIKLGSLEEGLAELERAVELDPAAQHAHSRLVFYSAFSAKYDSERILAAARRFDAAHTAPLATRQLPFPHDRSPDRRLRVGYVSADFRDHVQRLFTMPVLREHDHAAFEVVCYSSTTPADAWTERIKAHADAFHDVTALDANDLAQRIRDDRIDVLVDLSMHMDGQRSKIFAQKPAPVQIAWLAYPGTTGITGMDYRLTDPQLDPPGAALPYSERTLWLPNTFWCYDPGSTEPAVGALPALAAGHVTFGCLNNVLKSNRAVLELWARVLKAVPDSKFLLLAPSERARAQARQVFEAGGVDPARLDFVGLQWRKDYLATYQRIDIALDCVPYNGHTTSLDAFWMGVPVVTLVGNTVVGRAGLSQAHNLQLLELVAESGDEFVQKATALAGDLPRLAALRHGLRARLESSPLMDAPRFTRDLEGAYREAWQRWCRNG